MILRRSFRPAASAVALLTAGAVLAGCTIGGSGDNSAHSPGSPAASAPASATSRVDEAKSSAEESPAPHFTEASVTIRSVGDILIHSEVYTDAATNAAMNATASATGEGGTAAAGGYDFAPMLAPVAKYMRNADITTANMEVPVAGPAFELSGYPAFNSPPQIIDALNGAGVDIVNNATNHSMDRGTGGR
ncbi:CapA family protein [Corynebacterium urinipleomorphum]|uniref:CapA family protein n=1 Tax=Corynebacterium urinipleomorphum TaxID=1852380 RepID=UPI000B358377|nr:CapA family protein [Corynebacterium urinipleomorphum]